MDATTRQEPVTAYEEGVDTSYRRPRRRGGSGVSLLAVLLILAAIAVVGDRVAERYAAQELKAQLVAELQDRGVTADATEVSIGGFPFLDQVARGRYESITIDMTGVRLAGANGRPTTLPTLHAVATGVNADTADVVQGQARISADQVDGTALVSFSTLQTIVDYSSFNLRDVHFAESGGGLKVTGMATIAGSTIPITAVADVSVVAGQFQVRLRDATAVGLAAPAVVRDYLSGLAERSIAARLPALPFGLTLRQVAVQTRGLAVTATGRGVALVT